MLADVLSFCFFLLLYFKKKKKKDEGVKKGSDTVAISTVCDKDLLQVESK